MASKGTPLGIGLGIDFSKLDADLATVANKIEKVGSSTTLKVGTLSGLAKGGGLDTDQVSHQMGQVGVSLANGMATGVGRANAVLLSFAASINAQIGRIAGMMSEMFSRIDVAIKGHRWTNMLTGLSLALGNFAMGAAKKLTPLQQAMGGAFGNVAKTFARIFNTLFENLGTTITKSMDKAAANMSKVMDKTADSIQKSMTASMNEISVTMQLMASTMKKSMTASLDAIIKKFRDLRVSSEAAAGGIGKATGRFDPKYFTKSEDVKSLRVRQPIDLPDKIKPPSQAAVTRFFREIGQMGPSEINLFEKTKVKTPQPSGKLDFKGAMPKPQMGQEFLSVIKESVTMDS